MAKAPKKAVKPATRSRRAKAAPTDVSPPCPETGPGSKGKRTPLRGDILIMLEMIGEGASLRQACIKQGFAHAEALRVIRADDAPDGLAYQYAQAREANGDYYADQVTTIATLTVNGKLKADAARVAIDAHKWRAGQMAPKVWGIKATTQLTGADGGAVKIETTANVTFLDIARRMERLAGGGATDARPADGVAGDGAVEPTHA